jgi:membrane protein DedA with SNARE-associated domain
MGSFIDQLVLWMAGLPGPLVYVVVGAFAAVENLVPPVPADVVALFGGFLAGQGTVNPWAAFVVVWLCNVSGALLVYWLGRRYGTAFFQGRLGRFLLQPHQMEQLAGFYEKHGTKVIFASRFLPAFRAVVPIFAGTSGLGFVRTAIPIMIASAIWYGLIVYAGATAGRNWAELRAMLDSSGRWLGLGAAILILMVGVLWWRTRRRGPQP